MERERGRWRGREGGTVQKREFSVFIYNLPGSLDQYGMKGIFQKAGKIIDIHIPSHQKSKRAGKYGFVRFSKLEDAMRCIHLFNKGRIRGMKVYVSMARPKRQAYGQRKTYHQGRTRNVGEGMEWRKKEKVTNQGVEGQEHEKDTMQTLIKGKMDDASREWLERTLVCTTGEPRDMAALDSAMLAGFGQPYKLRALSCVQFLVTFPTAEIVLEVLENQEELKQWFTDIKKWGLEDRSEVRRVWLDVYGVPPHGWTWENFKAIVETWGSIICLGKSTLEPESFEVMRVLIATKLFRKIEDEILLALDYGGYRVMVREVATINHAVTLVDVNTNNEVQSQDIPGFEDIDDNISNNEADDEAWKNSEVQIFSNGTADKEPQRSNECGQKYSSETRTKTVSLSQNGYSEELRKVNQHLRALGNRVEQEESQKDSSNMSPPGFESGKTRVNSNIDVQVENENKFTAGQLRENEKALSDQTHSLGSQKCAGKSQDSESPQITGSSSHRPSYKKILLQSNAESLSSTPESLVKLAQESLQIGELLGVRVTGSVEAAISRIITPLKQLRKKNKKAKRNSRD